MVHLSEEELILHHYGEGENPDQARAHLESCAVCREAYARLQRLLALVDQAPAPVPADDYEARLWVNLRPQLMRPAPLHRPVVIPVRRWAWVAATAAAVLVAFLAGRYWSGRDGLPPGATANARDRILVVAVGDHLERSQMLLVELIAADPGDTVDIARQQARARDLVTDNRLYRQVALRDDDRTVAAFLGELERVLVEIANRPSVLPAAEFESFRKGIERNGILFKVRVMGTDMRLRERNTADSLQQLT